MPTPLPELKINSQATLIKSKNYEIPFDKDIYILLMEKYEDDKIYFQLRKRNNFGLYHCIYSYKEIVKLFFLQTEIYNNISKIPHSNKIFYNIKLKITQNQPHYHLFFNDI